MIIFFQLYQGRWGSLTPRKNKVDTFVIDIQTEGGIFDNVQKVISNFVEIVNFKRGKPMGPNLEERELIGLK